MGDVTGLEQIRRVGSQEPDLAPYLIRLRADLEKAFRESDWEGLRRHLDRLATIGESEGHRERSLRAQSLREVLGHRGGGRGEEPGKALLRHYHELSFYLSHLQWISN